MRAEICVCSSSVYNYNYFCILGLSSLPDAVFSSEGFQVKSFLLEYSTFLTIGVLWVGTTERFTSVKFPLLHRARVTGTLPAPNPVYYDTPCYDFLSKIVQFFHFPIQFAQKTTIYT